MFFIAKFLRFDFEGENARLSNPSVVTMIPGDEGVRLVIRAAIVIEDEAEKQLNPSPLRQAVQKAAPKVFGGVPETEVDRLDQLPTIQVDEDFGEDIPFN